MKRFRKRTRLFIAKRFQIRYISLIMIFIFASAILTGYTVYITTWAIFGQKLAAVYPQALLLDIVEKVNMILLLRLIFLSPLVILISLILSNRIAGPIFSIKKFLRKVCNGNYESRLKLRKEDELQDLAGSLNGLVSRLACEKDRRLKKLDIIGRETEELRTMIMQGTNEKGNLTGRVLKLQKGISELV